MGYHWPNDKLLALGTEVQTLYPELESWRPYLAAEAHLLYAARSTRDPEVIGPRKNEFLDFLRTTIARVKTDKP
jgi:hypothetical protein